MSEVIKSKKQKQRSWKKILLEVKSNFYCTIDGMFSLCTKIIFLCFLWPITSALTAYLKSICYNGKVLCSILDIQRLTASVIIGKSACVMKDAGSGTFFPWNGVQLQTKSSATVLQIGKKGNICYFMKCERRIEVLHLSKWGFFYKKQRTVYHIRSILIFLMLLLISLDFLGRI